MRMRFKPYARPELLACDFHVHEPLTHAGHWHELYARPEQPLHLELGCGKGGFLSQLAPLHPDINYLGIDITDKVLILAKRKVEAAYAAAQLPPDNVKIASLDIERLSGVFSLHQLLQPVEQKRWQQQAPPDPPAPAAAVPRFDAGGFRNLLQDR